MKERYRGSTEYEIQKKLAEYATWKAVCMFLNAALALLFCILSGKLWLGEEALMVVPEIADADVWVGIRPEGFVPVPDGPMTCRLRQVEVMGRDTSVVAAHPAMEGKMIRAIISAETKVDPSAETVRFALKRPKVHLFSRETEERIDGEK